MAKVLDLEKVETELKRELPKPKKDTWVLKLPPEVCEREGFAKGTLVSLTVRNSGIETSFIRPPSLKLQKASKKILVENRELYEELKKLDD